MKMEAQLRISAELKYLDLIRRFVQDQAKALGVDRGATFDIILAVDEAVTNVIVHGYQGQPGAVEIEVGRNGDDLTICLRDRASPFDPTTVPAPDITLPLEERPIGGMGIYLITQLVDEMTYRTTPQGGNELILVKKGVV